MLIRRAEERDIPKVGLLLNQVLNVHASKRPDIFKTCSRKYNDDELKNIFKDNKTPVFVYEDDDGDISGYAFCVLEDMGNSGSLNYIKTLYIDDICVDENKRRGGIGKALYEHCKVYAKEHDCYNITLNVWELNENAMAFYQSLGMKPLKTEMEEII